jgi:prepilin-type N-terminal cleavage/methylation domain-containing protein
MIATTIPTHRSSSRRGFTLVEVLVATALIVFIMVILTEAFSAGIGVFRLLKAQGDMQEKLRNANNLLVEDLRQPHFDLNQKKLSNLYTSPVNTPAAGYFFIQQPGSLLEGSDGFGVGSNRMANGGTALCFSIRRNGIQPSDYFSARIVGPDLNPALPAFLSSEAGPTGPNGGLFGQGSPDYWFVRNQTVPPPPYNSTQSGTLISQWAEVGWFLTPELDSAGNPILTSGAGGLTQIPMFTLRRRFRVLVPDDPTTLTSTLNSNANNFANRVQVTPIVPPAVNPINLWGARYCEVSCAPDVPGGQSGYIYFNTPSDLLNTQRQVMPQTLVPYGGTVTQFDNTVMLPVATEGLTGWVGDDIVLSDVISFNVRILGSNFSTNGTGAALSTTDFIDVPTANALFNVNSASYNTGSFSSLSLPTYTINALEITIRVWDLKTSRSRQITFVVDM